MNTAFKKKNINNKLPPDRIFHLQGILFHELKILQAFL
jgi:hypothetical protein